MGLKGILREFKGFFKGNWRNLRENEGIWGNMNLIQKRDKSLSILGGWGDGAVATQ